jgi:hypothetical protein
VKVFNSFNFVNNFIDHNQTNIIINLCFNFNYFRYLLILYIYFDCFTTISIYCFRFNTIIFDLNLYLFIFVIVLNLVHNNFLMPHLVKNLYSYNSNLVLYDFLNYSIQFLYNFIIHFLRTINILIHLIILLYFSFILFYIFD